MKPIIRFLWAFFLCTAVSVPAQQSNKKPNPPEILTNPDPTKPPPFLEVPGDSRSRPAVDTATAAIAPGLRAKIDAAQKTWEKSDAGEFHPSLVYVGGSPNLILITTQGESPALEARRLKAALTACEFLLDDAAFGRAVICIATFDGKNPATFTTRNAEVHRDDFQKAVKKAGKSAKLDDALVAAHRDSHAIKQINADLGIQ